ncbi:ATP-binding protein [Clostridioides difficile]|nr:ATP-binding protein [Clostridioides difficile]
MTTNLKEQDRHLETLELNQDTEYKCLKCKDRLFIETDEGFKECKCRKLRIAENILKNSGVSEEFRKLKFDNFNYQVDSSVAKAFTKAIEYSNYFEQIREIRRNSIIFMGQVGSGKTHLSLAIANSLMNRSISVIYMPYRDSMTLIKQNIMDEETYRREVGKYKSAKVLLIDDLYKGNITNSDINIMFEIINYRYLNKMPLIVSTEKNFDELLEIDEVIGSRLIEMSKNYLIELKGKRLNYRIYGG